MSGEASQLAGYLVAEANYQRRHALESHDPKTRWEHYTRRDILERTAERIRAEGDSRPVIKAMIKYAIIVGGVVRPTNELKDSIQDCGDNLYRTLLFLSHPESEYDAWIRRIKGKAHHAGLICRQDGYARTRADRRFELHTPHGIQRGEKMYPEDVERFLDTLLKSTSH